MSTATTEPDRWAEHLPPKGCIVDEFGQVWEVTYLNIWGSGKRQYTVRPPSENGSSSP